MSRLLVFLVAVMALLPVVFAQAGRGFYFHVTDCETGAPIVGAIVAVLRGASADVASTNATGHAYIDLPSGDYSYYVSMQGYRTRGGEARFTAGMVFSICLFKATEGFWNIVSEITMWQGDIHAGGRGWAMLKLKNLEDGVFNITRLEIWVAGYNSPISTLDMPSGAVLDRVEKFFNMTVAPPQDSPTGRLKAELRLKATYRQPDGRVLGPLTIISDLGYVMVQSYRTMVVQLLDYWGINRVPNATLVLESSLTGGQYVFKANGSGAVLLQRIPEGAYRVTVLYDSPYTNEKTMVNMLSPVLADLAANPVIRNKLYEAHVKVKSLSGKPVEAEVHLGNVKQVAEIAQVSDTRSEAVAVFRNVPRGQYRVEAYWHGVKVFQGSVSVDEPLARPSPGGLLEAKAEVGDIVLHLRDTLGRRLGTNVTVTIQPAGETVTASDTAVFTMLPRGEYILSATAYNRLLKKDVEVGRYTFSIPDNHGEHEARLAIFDARVKPVASDGSPAPVEKAVIEGEEFSVAGGYATLYGITAGRYRVSITYMGVAVFDEAVDISSPDVEVRLKIHPLKMLVTTRDNEPLASGEVTIEVSGKPTSLQIKDGKPSQAYLPEGGYPATVRYMGAEVFRGQVSIASSETTITVDVARPVVTVVEQSGAPIPNAEVEVVGLAKAATTADGSAVFQQVPIRSYPYRVLYNGVEAATGTLTPGSPAKVTILLTRLVVKAVNELGSPLEAEIELVRGGRLVAKHSGAEAVFSNLPSGAYIIRASYGTKSAEKQVVLDKPVNEASITLPVAAVLGVPLSLAELQTIITPLVAVGVAVAALLLFSKARKKAEALLKK
jgi:hypothetical protein